MPRLAFTTDTRLRGAKPRERDYRIGCGGQLFLRITPTGFKYWQLRYYTHDGRETVHQFASYPKVSLADAKKLRDDLLPRLRSKDRPVPVRAHISNEHHVSFDECATRYIEAHSPSWKNAKHAQQWRNTLAQYASPVFGSLPVQSITRTHVLRCLEPIWHTRTETASRVRSRIESVLDSARALGLREGENPAVWKGGLQNLLSAPAKMQKVVNHPALPWSEIPAFFARLRTASGTSAVALSFLILTASRTGEVLAAHQREFDGDVWIIPGERMKANREHRVPLSKQAQAIVSKRPIGDGWLFSADGRSRPLSSMALAMQLRRMDMGHVTVHGFRSSFRDWCAECTNYPREVCEHALAHQLPDKVEAAYMRSDLLNKRRALMAEWANFCYSAG